MPSFCAAGFYAWSTRVGVGGAEGGTRRGEGPMVMCCYCPRNRSITSSCVISGLQLYTHNSLSLTHIEGILKGASLWCKAIHRFGTTGNPAQKWHWRIVREHRMFPFFALKKGEFQLITQSDTAALDFLHKLRQQALSSTHTHRRRQLTYWSI